MITKKELPASFIPFVDLFCGAGGLSVGFEKAGFKPIFALDNDPAAIETFRFNHPDCRTVCSDIEQIQASDIFEAAGTRNIPVIVGGPNCQGVSLRGKRDPNDPKNKMFHHFHRLIAEVQPEWFVMENVPGLLHKHNRDLISDIFRAFEKIGYRCGADILLAADYGVPQLRYRLFLIGNRHGAPIVFPSPTHSYPFEQLDLQDTIFSKFEREKPSWRTVADAIADLPPIENGGGTSELAGYFKGRRAENDFVKWCRGKERDLKNHVCHRTNDYNINLIQYIPQGKNWKSIPEEIRPPRFKRVALKDHTTTYGRLSWKMPARTITCYFNNITCGAFTHPEQQRGISVREGARLQSFPDNFKFFGPLARQYRQVGNAVPCLLASHIARTLAYQINCEVEQSEKHLQATVEFSKKNNELVFNRPLKGMRFNLDKHLVTK
ncbi:DNA cytosine methyltransferase [Desulfonatronum parangueonense]